MEEVIEEEEQEEVIDLYSDAIPQFILTAANESEYGEAEKLLKEAEKVEGVIPDVYVANLKKNQLLVQDNCSITAPNVYVVLQPFLCDDILNYR